MIREPGELAREVVNACLAMGFARAGVAEARATSWRNEFERWLSEGKHGDMEYMSERLDQRLDVTVMLPGARSVIMVADQYAARGDEGEESKHGVGVDAIGVVARYARGADYHAHIRRRLHALADRLRVLYPGAEFRTFVDTAPVMEREHAVRAGLGFIGKHTLLISPRVGSWLLLGGVATTLELVQKQPERSEAPQADALSQVGCGSCTKCIDACPTAAITEYQVDARRCVSYLTLEHRGEIDPALHAGIGNRLIGCDVCQEVCPFNAGTGGGRQDDEARVNSMYSGEGRATLKLLDVLGWTEADRRREMSGSAGKRADLDMLRRNAVIALGNAAVDDASTRETAIAALRAVASDPNESAVVRSSARVTLERLGIAR